MATMTEEFTRMRHDCDDAQARRRQLAEDTREHVKEMVRNVQQQLADFHSDMQHVHDEITDMTNRVRNELREFGKDLKTGGKIFRKERKRR